MRVLSIYSGIAGLDLAAHQAGMTTVAFCEADPFCRSILALRFPGVPIYHSDEEITSDRLQQDGIGPIDLIQGGPPCQAASAAGKRGGDSDLRWRWPEFIRIVGDLKPRWFVAENPTGILSLRHGDGTPAFGGIVATLSQIGYGVVWETHGAANVGAPHRRERVFIVGRRLADPTG